MERNLQLAMKPITNCVFLDAFLYAKWPKRVRTISGRWVLEVPDRLRVARKHRIGQCVQKPSLEYISEKVAKRIWSKVDFADCWIWTGSCNGVYPTIKIDGDLFGTRRIIYEIEYNRRPRGYLKSSCGNPRCLRPTHLLERPTNRERINKGLWLPHERHQNARELELRILAQYGVNTVSSSL